MVGENSTYGGEGIISGIYNKLSLSAGYSGFETDGYRENNDQIDDIANVFAQYEINYKTSLQAEYRYRDNKRGDLQQRFFEDDFLPDLQQEDETNSVRLGLRHAFTPGSVLIGNFSYQEADRSLDDLAFIELPFPPPLEEYFSIKGDQEAYTGELQHLFRSENINLVSGAGYFQIQSDDLITDEVYDPFFTPPFLVFSSDEQRKTDTDHANVYLYSYLNFLKNFTFTLGASGDFYEKDEDDRDDRDMSEEQFNPKFGVTWNLSTGTTLRGAAFRTFKRTLITDQTLEPTQVAGFNQFFDDINATSAWVYGAAVDQKFTKSIYGGAQFTYRDLEVPYYDDISTPPAPPDLVLKQADWEEYLGRAYVYWAFHEWFAFRAEYLYEKIERDDEFAYNIGSLKTHRFPLGLNFFHPSGISAGVTGTYVDQEGDHERLDADVGEFTPGDDSFWLVDAALSYRLPKRFGFISVGVRNLFDESFRYADTDLDNPLYQPERTFFGKITLAFP